MAKEQTAGEQMRSFTQKSDSERGQTLDRALQNEMESLDVKIKKADISLKDAQTEQIRANTQITDDPWIHRSKNMKCPTCMYFAAKGKLGRCRRRCPTMNGYPVVTNDDWCGDHKLNECKVA